MCAKCGTGTMNRRTLMAGGLVLACAGVVPAGRRARAARPSTPDEALQKLIAGNARYVANTPVNTDHSKERFSRAAGQQPFAAVVACSDSRVVPELIFDQAPGDLFVVRVAGNFINEDGLASLEFGAAVLGVQAIVVLGHSGCGAVDATIKSVKERELPPGHLPSLVDAIRPAVYDVMAENPPDLLAAAIDRNAVLNARKSETSEPVLAGMHASGALVSVAANYDIATGEVSFL
ncbi:carbonic anhydrase [Roseibium sp.]|uniref:carbonic anhydrase n=2 Tax=Roseibium sp. TaxID=1936156 RepID=UPI0025CC90E4|nr:carbonic anhydrase [Roseibium sp.]